MSMYSMSSVLRPIVDDLKLLVSIESFHFVKVHNDLRRNKGTNLMLEEC